MKLSGYLDDFLKNTVNINQTRIDTLTSRVSSVEKFLSSNETFEDDFIDFVPQGSYAHKTIIKPSSRKPEFDADVLLYLSPVDDWEPKDYVENLYSVFRGSATYRDKVRRNSRCVMLDYASEFSLDVVPCILRKPFLIFETEHITNRLTNEEEETKPKDYTEWFLKKDRIVTNHRLVKVVRLAKYLRDIKQTFSVKSILLTTLFGMQIDDLDSSKIADEFCDLPTSLKTLFNRLNDWLQYREEMPIVTNPVLDSEDFNRHWDQEKYSNFRSQWSRYTGWINDAYDETDKDKSIEKWRKIFGSEYAKSAAVKQESSARASAPIPAHCQPPLWPVAGLIKPNIKITVHSDQEGTNLGALPNDMTPLDKGLWLRLELDGDVGFGYDLYWQVVNTGEEAASARGLRGEIFKGNKIRWETTSYQGLHWVECYLVNRKKKICTGRSGRYYVKIK